MSRREEFRKSRRSHRLAYEVLGGAFLVLCLVAVGSKFFGQENKDFHMNLFTETAGIVVTVFVVNRWYAHRERASLQRRLIREAGSRSHDIAISAVEWMEREGGLRGEDGLLKGANLREAQLEGAWMDGANLEKAEMRKADLRSAKLNGARLHGAQLPEARLYRAKLSGAKMCSAYLHSAYAERADFSHACLTNATLDWLCLRDANLNDACFKYASLHTAKLMGAALLDTNFDNADLCFAELRDAKYHRKANWEKAKLRYVYLEGVDLSDANMKGADLEYVILKDADLWGTNLQGANLLGANLQGAKINPIDPPEESIFDGPEFDGVTVHTMGESRKTNLLGATLPDGTEFTEESDYSYLRRFTDPSDEMLAALDAYCNRP